MDQQELDIQPKAEVSQEPEFPFTIRLMQFWLTVSAVLPMLGGVFVLLRILIGLIREPSFILNFNITNAVGLMKLLLIIGFGVFALVTIWGLQKRARVSRWLALVVICIATAKTAHALLGNAFDNEHVSAGLLLVDSVFLSFMCLLQVTMLYRFAFGKIEKAFLSK
jgi:hypothetical protein